MSPSVWSRLDAAEKAGRSALEADFYLFRAHLLCLMLPYLGRDMA
jgi:hypothetical protein